MNSPFGFRMLPWLRMITLGVSVLSAPLLFAHCGGGMESNTDSVSVTEVQSGKSPQDSAPNSTGTQVYFIGSDNRGAGIFRVGASGGTVSELLIGAPLVQPQSLVVSSDDKLLYVADPKAGGKGALFVLDAGTGAVVRTLAADTEPRGVDVVSEGGADQIYFTGRDKTDGAVGLQRVRADGSALTIVAKGSPFSDPSGVVVKKTGEAYVTDTPYKNGEGRILKVSGGVASEFQSGLFLGGPAGISLTLDEATLVVSALRPTTATDAVLLIDLATRAVTVFDRGISGNTHSGGVHRSRLDNMFTWSDSSFQGRVYVIRL